MGEGDGDGLSGDRPCRATGEGTKRSIGRNSGKNLLLPGISPHIALTQRLLRSPWQPVYSLLRLLPRNGGWVFSFFLLILFNSYRFNRIKSRCPAGGEYCCKHGGNDHQYRYSCIKGKIKVWKYYCRKSHSFHSLGNTGNI